MTDYETMPFEEWRRRIMERGREIHLANGSRIITTSTPERTFADAIVEDLERDLEEEIEHELPIVWGEGLIEHEDTDNMIPNPMMEMLRESVLKTIRGSEEDDLIKRGYMKP